MERPAVTTIPSRPLKSAHDYIAVGAGSGGAAVTRRLVDAGADVLLIEAGPPGIGLAAIDDPGKWVSLGRSAYDWGHDYAPPPHVDSRTIGIPRGKGGGSSAINAMMWYRGHPADYDAWEAAGARGWARWKVPRMLDWNTMTHNPFVDVTKVTTTLYASDRDVFLFLLDDTHPIEAGRLPDGSPDLCTLLSASRWPCLW
jgi:choline dehydrogenase-like flavoprotein